MGTTPLELPTFEDVSDVNKKATLVEGFCCNSCFSMEKNASFPCFNLGGQICFIVPSTGWEASHFLGIQPHSACLEVGLANPT